MILRIIILISILVAIAFLAKWLLGKFLFFQSRKKLLVIISICIPIILFIIYALSITFYMSYVPKEKFKETIWINKPEDRYKIIDDLLESDYLIGKKKEKINELFGAPNKINEEDNTLIFELTGWTALDYKYITLKLFMKDNVVQNFEYETRYD